MNAVAVIGSGLLLLVGATGASAQSQGSTSPAQMVRASWGDISGERDEVEAPRAAIQRQASLGDSGDPAVTVVAAIGVTTLAEGEDVPTWMPTETWGDLSTEHDEFEAP